jgi:hypothetical protein
MRVACAIACLLAGITYVACSANPSAPSATNRLDPGATLADTDNYHAAAEDKGHIDGWFDGETVQLYYTKSFFCAEPPSSGAPTNCEVGAPAEVAPKPGEIRTIYAIAAAGIQPDPATLACRPGTPCLNHPGMLDLSRIGRGSSAPGVPHSHIVSERGAGWFNTVNIRVFDLGVWNQIAAAKNLETVRQLQSDPNVGGRGLISQDTPTNIYFFIASWH